jgi:RNA polymerase sigma factor (sigma-70 family)
MSIASGAAAAVSARRGGELSRCYQELDVPLREYLMRNTRSSHDADDLAQEVYLRLVRRRSLAGISDPRAFVFRAAKNLLRDRSRRRQTRERWLDGAPAPHVEPPDITSDPSLEFESLEMLRGLERVLSGLKASTRMAFLRYRVEECAHVEIAAEMGVSISMVEKHVKAATRALRDAGIQVDRL